MATGAPIGQSSSAPPQRPLSPPSTPMTWEGEKMFNIYIYDYCVKRGFNKTAHELLNEAELSPDSTPPINARQGLLFEWWSVFWVLFTAKSSGNGREDAMLYTLHQSNQAAQRQRMAPTNMNRFVNNMPQRGLMPNGSIPNGLGPATMSQGPMPTGGPNPNPSPFPMGTPGPQMNGIVGPPGPPTAPGAPGPQSQNFQQQMGQRPPPGGQQRGANGGPPFHSSPTMAHSPQHNGNAPGQPQHVQPPMGQLGPSPHMQNMSRGSMLPPNGPQGMNNQGMMSGQQPNPPTPTFAQLGRPPSRAATPGQNNMMYASPSLAARQPPGSMNPQVPDMRQVEMDIIRLGQSLPSLKQELGLGDKDNHSLTPEEKQRIVHFARSRGPKLGPPGPNNAAAGPSGTNHSMQPPNQRNPQQGQRLNKRNSTSPGQEHGDLPRNESSPPDRKRIRRSPGQGEQAQMTPTPGYPQQPPQQQGGPQQQQHQQQQQMPNGMIRGPMGPQVNGFPQPPGMPNMGNSPGMNMNMQQMGQPLGIPQMGNAMSPGMAHQTPGGLMQPQMMGGQPMKSQPQYRQNMMNLHKGHIAGNAGSPAASDPPFNPAQGPGGPFVGGPANNRMKMMPPPSPAVNGPPKDQNAGMKDNKIPEGSPQNAQNVGGPMPVQGQQGAPNAGGPGQGNTAPPTPVPGSATAPGLLGPPSMVQTGPPMSTPDLFSTDFIQSVASSLDEFEMFRPDGDINFERDFGQWFSPDDVGGGPLEMK